MEEEYKHLERIGNEVTISISDKDLVIFKILYASIPRDPMNFDEFILLAAKYGLRPAMWEAPNSVQAQIYLAMQGMDPFVSTEELIQKSGMPTDVRAPKFNLKEWKSPLRWHMNWRSPNWVFGWAWITPRWKRP